LSLAVSQVSGGIVNVPVLLDHARPDGSTGMTEAIIGLTYDPKALSVSSADITLGSLPASGSGWRLVSVVDAATGQIAIDLYSTTAITQAQAGSLVNIAFHTVPGAYVPATAVQLVSSVTPQGHWYATEVVDAQDKFVLSPGVDQIMIQTGAPVAMPASTTVVAPIVEHGQVLLDNSSRIEGISLLGAEARDGLAVISNGSLAGETPQATNVVVTGALAFQQNSPLATQQTGQALQVSSLPVFSAVLGSSTPRQLADRLLMAWGQWTAAVEDSLASIYNSAVLGRDWLAIPNQTPSQAATESSATTQPGQAAAAVRERIAVVDEVFTQVANEWDDFGDLASE
jgi:hypothetical protein